MIIHGANFTPHSYPSQKSTHKPVHHINKNDFISSAIPRAFLSFFYVPQPYILYTNTTWTLSCVVVVEPNDALVCSIYQLKVVERVIERQTNKPTPSNTHFKLSSNQTDGQKKEAATTITNTHIRYDTTTSQLSFVDDDARSIGVWI